MTDHAPVKTKFLGSAEQPAMEWSRPHDLLAAPPPPNTPGGHHPSYLGTVRPDGRPHATRVGARWYDGDIYFLSGPGTRKSRNLATNPACTIAMRLEEGLDLVLEGEAAPVDDPALLDAVGAVIRQSGWPVQLTAGGFTAPFGPQEGGPPWLLYRFVFHTAISQAGAGATRWRFAR
jgi:hypothetical protein